MPVARSSWPVVANRPSAAGRRAKARPQPAATPTISTRNSSIGRSGADGAARGRRRIDHLELHRIALGFHLTAQAQLLAVAQQLVVLLLEHVVIAVDPRRLGGKAGLAELAAGQLREFRLQRGRGAIAARSGSPRGPP